jgi:hypothetical protein
MGAVMAAAIWPAAHLRSDTADTDSVAVAAYMVAAAEAATAAVEAVMAAVEAAMAAATSSALEWACVT